MEALLTLNFGSYSGSITDVLNVFGQIGWGVFNPQGEIEYLPIGDDDKYNWLRRRITEQELYKIVSEKVANHETVGINLFYEKGAEGVSMLVCSVNEVVLSICINRRLIHDNYTDTAWYLENIVYKLLDSGVRLHDYRIEEYED